MIDYTSFFIDGNWVSPSGPDMRPVVNPATERVIGHVPVASRRDIDRAVEAARRAFDDPQGWAHMSAADRGRILYRFAEEMDKRADEMTRRVASQNGMPIATAEGFEGAFPPALLRFYADMMADGRTEDLRTGIFGGISVVNREPIGVVGAIVPWNVPQGITALKLAPALAAGCTLVLKPAEETVLDAYLLIEAADAAGLPAGVLNMVPGGRDIGARLVEHPGVDKISFTGSTAAGREIGATCGHLLRPVTLELGGKSAAIVLDDADLESMLESFFGVTFINNGQVCWLNSRVLAPAGQYSRVVDTLTDLARSAKVGDPLVRETDIGPLVSERQRARVEGYIARGLAEGATMTTGGGRPSEMDRGFFIEPTVFADLDNSATIAREEIFGPVISVIAYRDEDEAIAIANDSDYGLGGTVWTKDQQRARTLASRIQTGTVGINAYSNDPVSPFGGMKASGIGRELGPEGLAAFQQLKTVYLDPTLS